MGKPSGAKPIKVGESEAGAAQASAPAAVAPAAAPDPARAAIEQVQAEQRRAEVVEPSPAEKSAAFAEQVRKIKAQPDVKGAGATKRVLLPARLQLAEQAFTRHYVIAEFGTTVDDLLVPSYWAHVAKRFKVGDEITVDCDDGTYRVRLVVTERGQLYARVKLDGDPLMLQFSEPDVDATIPPGYELKWLGPHEKYAVIHNGGRLKSGFSTKGDASRWLQGYLRGLAA